MSFLGKALSVVGAVAGIAAAVATGGTLGVLAGAFLAVGAAANLGIIGGSIGKFMNSGAGRGLLGAVSLGSVAYAAYGQTALQAQSTSANTEIAAASQSSVSADSANIAAESNDSFLKMTGTEQDAANLAASHPEAALSTNTDAQSLDQLNKATISQSQSPLGAGAQQAAAQQEQAPAAAEDATHVDPAVSKGWASRNGVPADAAGTPPPETPAAAGGAGPDSPTGPLKPGEVPDSEEGDAPASGFGKYAGMLGKALDTKGGAAAITGIGSAIGGIGQGIAQKQAIEDQLKAQEWGNQQWQQPGQVANLMSASARPITVPQGYLQRAQQVRSMMNSGVAPLPAASPGAPLAPSPVHA